MDELTLIVIKGVREMLRYTANKLDGKMYYYLNETEKAVADILVEMGLMFVDCENERLTNGRF